MTAKRVKYPRAPRVEVDVTEEDIAKACRRDASHCVIAEAIKRQVTDALHVSVDLQTIRWTDKSNNLRYTYLTPRRAQMALVSYDLGHDVEPMAFQLRNAHVTASSRGASALKRALSKTNLASGGDSGAKNNLPTPRRVGGRTPPKMPTAGTRREYGLRALKA